MAHPCAFVGEIGQTGLTQKLKIEATLAEISIRSYISEPDRGRRDWEGKQEMQAAVYANRRRIRGPRGRRLMRRRGELIERSFAHGYETGGMRRVHLKHRNNIYKRLLVHMGGFNLGLVMRKLLGMGKPRRWQGLFSPIFVLVSALWRLLAAIWSAWRPPDR